MVTCRAQSGGVSLPRLLFVAPAMGSNAGWVTSQAEILCDKMGQAGYSTLLTSRVPTRARRVIDTVISIIRWRGAYDVAIVAVFSWKAFAITDVATLVLRRLGKPIVLVLHGGDLPRFTRRHPRWAGRVLRRGDALAAPSRYLQSELSHLGFDIEVVANVIDLEDYPYRRRSPARPELLWMRTFEDIYNPAMAVEVLAELTRRGRELHLTMGGQDRGLAGKVEARAAALGVSDRLTMAGFIDPPTKRVVMRDHDLFLNTNHIDNMPVSVVEAAAAGMAIVATSVGGIPYLLDDGTNARLVADGDVTAMADAVEEILDDPELAGRLSDGARHLAEQSAWPRVREQLISLVDAATDRR